MMEKNKTLWDKVKDMLNSTKFWYITIGAALFVLDLIANHTLSLITLIPVLKGWIAAVLGARVIDNFKPEK